jgi:hypothetical protein
MMRYLRSLASFPLNEIGELSPLPSYHVCRSIGARISGAAGVFGRPNDHPMCRFDGSAGEWPSSVSSRSADYPAAILDRRPHSPLTRRSSRRRVGPLADRRYFPRPALPAFNPPDRYDQKSAGWGFVSRCCRRSWNPRELIIVIHCDPNRGQTGVDQAALDIAVRTSLKYRGWSTCARASRPARSSWATR